MSYFSVSRKKVRSVPGNCGTHVKCSLLLHLGRRSLNFKRLRTQMHILRTARNAQASMHRVGARGVRTHPAPPFGLTKSASILDTGQHRGPRCSAQAQNTFKEVAATLTWAAEHQKRCPRPFHCACLRVTIRRGCRMVYYNRFSTFAYTFWGLSNRFEKMRRLGSPT